MPVRLFFQFLDCIFGTCYGWLWRTGPCPDPISISPTSWLCIALFVVHCQSHSGLSRICTIHLSWRTEVNPTPICFAWIVHIVHKLLLVGMLWCLLHSFRLTLHFIDCLTRLFTFGMVVFCSVLILVFLSLQPVYAATVILLALTYPTITGLFLAIYSLALCCQKHCSR